MCMGNLSLMQCYGVTGTQILTTLNMNYETIEPNLDLALNYGLLLAIGCVFKVLYLFNFLQGCDFTETPKPVEEPVKLDDSPALNALCGPSTLAVGSCPPASKKVSDLHPPDARSEEDLSRVSSLRVKVGATLRFENCQYTVKVKSKGQQWKMFPELEDRVIVQGCSASIDPGQVRSATTSSAQLLRALYQCSFQPLWSLG